LCRDLNALLGFQFRNPENDTADHPERYPDIAAAFAAIMASVAVQSLPSTDIDHEIAFSPFGEGREGKPQGPVLGPISSPPQGGEIAEQS
jgi:hypothetical protein